MPRRAAKQFLYGLSFLLFWAMIFSGTYLVWFRSAPSCFDATQNQDEVGIDCGGSCVTCELKNALPLTAQAVQVLSLNSQVTLVVRISNPNGNVAAEEFEYTFNLYGARDELLKAVSGKDFIYANRVKYLVVPGIDVSGRVARAELLLGVPVWRLANEFSAPLLNLRESNTEIGDRVITAGILVNEGNLPISVTTIQALYYSETRALLGASRTEVRDIAPFQNRRFEIQHPALPGIDLRNTQVIYEAKF